MLHWINNLEIKKTERRILRRNQTLAELKLWMALRNRKLNGFKFYRQFSVGKFIIDFYCHEKRLAIELDGEQHKHQKKYDFSRTIYLENHGITLIRFWNNDVETNLDMVCKEVLKHLL